MERKNGIQVVPTADLVRDKIAINVKVKAVVFKALGGYSAGAMPQAEAVIQALCRYCDATCSVMMISGQADELDFVHADDLPELVKNLNA